VSIEATRWVLKDVRIPESVDVRQRPHLRFLLLCLADHAGVDGRNAFPSLATLGDYTEMSRSTIIRGLDALEELGLIRVGSQAVVQAYTGRGDRIPKSYDLIMDDGVSYGGSSSNGVSQEAQRGVIPDLRMTPKPSFKPTTKPTTAADAAEPPAPQSKEAVDGPALNQRANKLAGEHYERMGKMGNVPAWLKMIRKALERGYEDGHVSAVLAFIGEHNWTVTEERLANQLRGGAQLPRRRPADPARPKARTASGMEIQG
jgi:Helix-turn-helix domain